jgi:GLPGLI family protein
MKRIFLYISFLLLTVVTYAQTTFIKKGKIEFERKTNTHRLYFAGEDGSFMEEFKKLIPQFKTDYFNLLFTEDKSVYKPGKETDAPKTGFFESPANENIVYKDFNQQIAVSQKQIFEGQFLLSDSLRKAEWKILPETRTIAGFECRKAITKIADSVVVVAFYTEEILPSNGPESFGGLPGMILEIAVPRLYTTWVATKLELINEADEKVIAPPTKGKKSNLNDVTSKVNDGIKDWGEKYRGRIMWFVML